MTFRFALTVAASFAFLLGAAHAQTGMDPASRDLLIEKLGGVYLTLAPADNARVPVGMRLADLHAERARIQAMQELAAGCTVCKAGREDRLKALRLYQDILAKSPEAARGKVLTQIGHLQEMTGQEPEAIATYQQILKDMKAPDVLAEANLSLGEVYFRGRDFAKAREHFTAVVKTPGAASRGLAAYRISWCSFNAGKLPEAIEGLTTILKTPELLNRGASSGVVQADRQFQEEVSRDLATFMSRGDLGIKEAKLVFDLSPEQAKVANVTYLAGEAERLGQAKAAVEIWRFAAERQTKPVARLEAQIRLAQLQMEQKLTAEAQKDFEAALSLWTQIPNCPEAECKELKTRLRKFVTDWNRIEKTEPSDRLLAAYQSYLKVFPAEIDMNLWAGQAAFARKQYSLALDYGHRGARLASDSKEATSPEHMEAGLLGAIEAAELSKETPLLHKAYDLYLQLSKKRLKALEVSYQKAKLHYDAAEYAPAVEGLKAVALSKEQGRDEIRKQAADLSLDGLVLLKDDARLEAWAREYAGLFPKDASEFSLIARKSVLTQATALAAKGDGGLQEAWAALGRFDVSHATTEEKASYFKNKLILAEKTNRFAEARQAADQLLAIPALSADDLQYALSRKAWLSELVLDFESALKASEKLTVKGDQRWLKLAMFAELAARDPKPFYSQYLKESADPSKKAAVAAQFVRGSKEPMKEIERNKTALSAEPEILADLYLESYAKIGGADVSSKALANPAIAKTAAGRMIARATLLAEFEKMKAKIVSHKVDPSTQRKMAATLKARVALLGDIEKLGTRAVSSGDWTSQLVTLDLIARENDRFYQEVLSLPVPAGLSGEDEQQYLMLLSQQAAPHQVRATEVGKKVAEIWESTPEAIDQLAASLASAEGPRRQLLLSEIRVLSEAAPAAKKEKLAAVSGAVPQKKEAPSFADLEKARASVRENPMSRASLEALLKLEKDSGHQAMVAYLEGRLATLGESK